MTTPCSAIQETGCPPFPLYLLIWLPPALMTGLMVGTDCCTNWPYYLWLVWCGFAWPVAAFFSYFQYKRRTRMVRTLLQIAHVLLMYTMIIL